MAEIDWAVLGELVAVEQDDKEGEGEAVLLLVAGDV